MFGRSVCSPCQLLSAVLAVLVDFVLYGQLVETDPRAWDELRQLSKHVVEVLDGLLGILVCIWFDEMCIGCVVVDIAGALPGSIWSSCFVPHEECRRIAGKRMHSMS